MTRRQEGYIERAITCFVTAAFIFGLAKVGFLKSPEDAAAYVVGVGIGALILLAVSR